MKRSAKGYNGTTAMSRQSPDVTLLSISSTDIRGSSIISFLEKCPVKKQRQVVAGLDEVLHVVAST